MERAALWALHHGQAAVSMGIRMKKSAGIVVTVVVLGLAYVGTSWYVGKRAETTIRHAVDQANQRLVRALGTELGGSGLSLSVSEYKRHLFSSDIVYTLQMKDPSGKPVEYLLSDDLQHGPFPFGALKEGHLTPLLAYSRARMIPSAVTQKWFDSLHGAAPVTAVTYVRFSGAGQSQWLFRPLDVQEPDQTFKFSGGTADVTFSKDFKDGVAVGDFKAISYSSATTGETLQISGIQAKSSTTMVSTLR